MRRDALALLTVCVGVSALWLACTRVNERYCEADTDCPRDQTCNVKAKQCQSSVGDMAMSVVDIAGRADFSDTPDSATPDLMPPPPECTKDSECAAKAAATPACVNGRCAPCTRNYQCPDAACVVAGSMAVGTCVAKSRMLYVDNNAGKCDAAGAGGMPYCRVDQALADVVPGTRDVILLRASADDYQNDGFPLIITTSVRIVGERADRTSKAPSFTDPVQVFPSMGGTPDIQFGMEDLVATVKRAGDSVALYCYRKPGDANGSLTLRWMRYESNPVSAVRFDNCNDITILNSVIVRNTSATAAAYAAVHIIGGDVKIANTVIARNTPPNSTAGGGLFLGEAGSAKLGTIELAFNTIADNTCKTSGGTPACNFHSDVAATMNYSIVTGANSLLSSAKITLNNSVTPTSYSGGGSGNVTSSGSVPKFVNSAANTADYHLTTEAANDVLRLPNISPSERSDIDSDPRPSADGKVDVGADQRVP